MCALLSRKSAVLMNHFPEENIFRSNKKTKKQKHEHFGVACKQQLATAAAEAAASQLV